MPDSSFRLRRLLVAALVVGCSDAEPGDLDRIPPYQPSVLGNGDRLATLNDPENPRPAQNADVFVSGVTIVAVDAYDETGDGSSAGNIYAQDLATSGAPPPYGGITLFDPSFSPPSLRVAPGDVVDVRGAYQEFAGPPSAPFPAGQTLPEIVGGSISLRFEYLPPEPIVIPLSELTSYDTGRKWIGMLVKVENVTAAQDLYCGAAPPSGDACDVPGRRHSLRLAVSGVGEQQLPTMTNALFDLRNSGAPLGQGTTYASIVGVVQYFFNFQIAPRSSADITP